MKTISKIPKTLKLIKENFKRYYKTNNSEYNIIIDETNEYYVEVLSVKSKYWYINLAQFLKNKKLPVVKPGTQSRRFTHIDDTIKVCFEAWKLNKNRHYSISSKNSHSVIQLAKMFKSKIKLLSKKVIQSIILLLGIKPLL